MDYSQIRSLKEMVRACLEHYPDTRNSDAALTSRVCSEYIKKNGNAYDPLTIHETVGRCRRKFQEQGFYLPTNPEVAKKRKHGVDEMRVAMGYPTKTSAGTPTPSWKPPSECKYIEGCLECKAQLAGVQFVPPHTHEHGLTIAQMNAEQPQQLKLL